ncbi:MAG: GNAT family N-acetyltransferase [Bacteroidota bacterium]
MNKPSNIRPIMPEEAIPLTKLARETFYRSFIHANPEQRMNAYLDAHMSEECVLEELQDPKNYFFLMMLDESWAGYTKIREAKVPDCVSDKNVIEIERFYIHQNFHAKGLGSCLMTHCVDWSIRRGKTAVWLGVWEENYAAIQFYQRKGFVKRGEKDFMFHDDLQTDWIMEKAL